MIVVTVNSGSTSVKLAAFDAENPGPVIRIEHEQHSGESLVARDILNAFLAKLRRPADAIAHRVVHGGTRFKTPARIDADVLKAIGQLSQLAPLHNPKALEWIDATTAVVGGQVAQIAAFDTSFFSGLPRVAGEYALAPGHGVDIGVRRYGFHGLAHEAMWQRWSELRADLPAGGRVITLQLGGGCSAAAIDKGRPLDTTMGFSPLEGLVMVTRSGDLDPAVVPYLQQRLSMTSEQVIALLNRQSGVAGMTGGVTDLARLSADPAPQSQFAVDLYCYRVRKYLGAYLAVLGGCEGIVFGGGVGEHVPAVRQRILAPMAWAGIKIDNSANGAAQGAEAAIHASDSAIAVQVIPVEEELVMVKGAVTVLKSL
jgi:acetate kinase